MSSDSDHAQTLGSVRLSVVVPAYGEEPAIAATVERIRTELEGVAANGGLEVIVVDDGSPDRTAHAARMANADRVVALPRNQGKGAAVRAGVLASNGRTVAFTDADLSYAPAQIETLMTMVETGWDVVVGSRRHRAATTIAPAGALRDVGGRVINMATKAVLKGGYSDTQCGLKAFRSDVAKLLFSKTRINGFAFDVELFMLAERHDLSLLEVPAEVENSDRSTVRVARDAAALLADLVRIKYNASKGLYELEPNVVESKH